MNNTALAILVLAAALLTGCGSKISGVYSGSGLTFLEKLDFKSDGKVEITFLGMTKEGTYVVADDRVKVTNGNDTQVLRIDEKGCLDGGGLIGKYCKGEAKKTEKSR